LTWYLGTPAWSLPVVIHPFKKPAANYIQLHTYSKDHLRGRELSDKARVSTAIRYLQLPVFANPSMTESPSRRTNSKGNRIHGLVGTVRRRMSSGLHNHRDNPPKRAKVIEKGKEKVRSIIARSSWGSRYAFSPARPLSANKR
jgi:hypothetical protein